MRKTLVGLLHRRAQKIVSRADPMRTLAGHMPGIQEDVDPVYVRGASFGIAQVIPKIEDWKSQILPEQKIRSGDVFRGNLVDHERAVEGFCVREHQIMDRAS